MKKAAGKKTRKGLCCVHGMEHAERNRYSGFTCECGKRWVWKNGWVRRTSADDAGSETCICGSRVDSLMFCKDCGEAMCENCRLGAYCVHCAPKN